MTDEHAETDTWPAPWSLPTRHLPATVSDEQPENGREDTPTVPDVVAGDSERRDRYAEALRLHQFDLASARVGDAACICGEEITGPGGVDLNLARHQASALSVVHEREVAELRAENARLRGVLDVRGDGTEFNLPQFLANHRAWTARAEARAEAAESREAALREAVEGLAGEWEQDYPESMKWVLANLRAVLASVPRPVAEVGAADTQPEDEFPSCRAIAKMAEGVEAALDAEFADERPRRGGQVGDQRCHERHKARMADALPEEDENPELVQALRDLPAEAYPPNVRAEAERLMADTQPEGAETREQKASAELGAALDRLSSDPLRRVRGLLARWEERADGWDTCSHIAELRDAIDDAPATEGGE